RQVEVPASNPGCIVDVRRIGLADFCMGATHNPSVVLRSAPRRSGGNLVDAMAHREGRECFSVAGESKPPTTRLNMAWRRPTSQCRLTRRRTLVPGLKPLGPHNRLASRPLQLAPAEAIVSRGN